MSLEQGTQAHRPAQSKAWAETEYTQSSIVSKDEGISVSGESTSVKSSPSPSGKSKPAPLLPFLLRRARPGLAVYLKGEHITEIEDESLSGTAADPAGPNVMRTQSFSQQRLTTKQQSLIMRAKVTQRLDTSEDTDWCTAPVASALTGAPAYTTARIVRRAFSERFGPEAQPSASPHQHQHQPHHSHQVQGQSPPSPSQQQQQQQQQPQSQPTAQPGAPRPRTPISRRTQPLVPSTSPCISIRSLTAAIDRVEGAYGSRSAPIEAYASAGNGAGSGGVNRSSTPASCMFGSPLLQTQRASSMTVPGGPFAASATAAAASPATPSSPVFNGLVSSTSVSRAPSRNSVAPPPPSGVNSMFRTTFVPHVDVDPFGVDCHQGVQPGHTVLLHEHSFRGPTPSPVAAQALPRSGFFNSGNGISSPGPARRSVSPKDAATALGAPKPPSGQSADRSAPPQLLALLQPSAHSFSGGFRTSMTALQGPEADDLGLVRRSSSAITAALDSRVVFRRGPAAIATASGAAVASAAVEGELESFSSLEADMRVSASSGGPADGSGGERADGEAAGDDCAGGSGGGNGGSADGSTRATSGELDKRHSSGLVIGQLLKEFVGEGPMSSAARQLAALHRATDRAQAARKTNTTSGSGDAPWRPRLTSRVAFA